jgi:D-sedoheptulose 7-phosphate isomerase
MENLHMKKLQSINDDRASDEGEVHTRVEVKETLAKFVRPLSAFLDDSFVASVRRVVQLLDDSRTRGGTIYIAGNGGSASTASHWVNDLGKATKKAGKPPMRVMSLNDNVSWLTALANDEGYHRVFSGQLENFARAGDILIVISASGNSPNLIDAVNLAKSRNVTTIGLLGFDGGSLKDKVDERLWLASEKGTYGLVEGAHSVLCHVLTACLADM